MMTRREAEGPFGGRSAALALFLGVTPQTIYRIPLHKDIPLHHAVMVARAYPDVFADWLAEFEDDIRQRREYTERWMVKHPAPKTPQPRLPFKKCPP